MCFKLNNVLFGLIARAINLVKVLKRCYKMKVLCALIYCYYEICNAFIDNFFFPKNEIHIYKMCKQFSSLLYDTFLF
jgi:hypothetical protein